jgi:hypothetical protein
MARAADFSIKQIGEFYSIDGTVQFLPGGYAVATEDGRTKLYVFRGSGFVLSHDPPPNLEAWTSFDWEGVDYLNQIDRKDLDPGLRALLPNAAHVKKVIVLDQPTGKTLSLVCYTVKSSERFVSLDSTDIVVAAVLDEEVSPNRPPKFDKLWEQKLKANESYGEFEHQSVPGQGDFILLYTASPGGDSVDRTLTIYKTSNR